MKITVIADVLGEENNGTTTACMNLVRFLESQGDEVTIVCCDKDKKGKEGYRVVGTYNLGPFNGLVAKNNVSLARPEKKVLYEAIKDCDIVHIMMPFALGKGAVKMAEKLDKPVTAGFHVQAENFTSHIGMMNLSIANYLTYKNFYKKLYRHVDGVHYPSEFIRETFEKRVHHKTNAFVISNGVHEKFIAKEVEKPEELKDKFVILFTGRYSKEKSHKVLVKAVAKSKYKDSIQLIFAGQGPREKEIICCAKKKKINMPIMKFFSKDELVNVINYSDLYCHPAEVEIEAIACLEAITCGLVPVISNSPRCATKAFALDEKNLFKCNNSKDLAKKIDYWIEHKEEKEQRSKEYLGFTRQFTLEECMKSMKKMMEECIESHENKKRTYYYHDPKHDDFAATKIKTVTIPDNYKFVSHNPFYKIGEFLINLIALPIVYLILKIVYLQRVKNKKVLKKAKKKGYFVYSNHTNYMLDAYNPPVLSFPRKAHIIVNPDAVSIKGLGTIVKMLGALPIPTSLKGFKNYKKAINELIAKKHVIAIYPEAHIWPYYTDIRPFGNESFHYPVETSSPCFTYTNIYVKRWIFKTPKVITYIDGPFYPDVNLPKQERIAKLRDEVYQAMKNRVDSNPKIKRFNYVYVEDETKVTKTK